MKIFIASDHAGFDFKSQLLKELTGYQWVDLGPSEGSSTDYPDWADRVAQKVSNGEGLGLLICGSGIGMSIRANRHSRVRAAVPWDIISARLSREHNDANVLCLGSRLIPYGLCKEIIDVFFKTSFAGGRHQKRVTKLDAPLNP